MLRRALDVGSGVEQQETTVVGGNDRADGRTVDSGEPAEHQQAGRDHGPGAAGADHCVHPALAVILHGPGNR